LYIFEGEHVPVLVFDLDLQHSLAGYQLGFPEFLVDAREPRLDLLYILCIVSDIAQIR